MDAGVTDVSEKPEYEGKVVRVWEVLGDLGRSGRQRVENRCWFEGILWA